MADRKFRTFIPEIIQYRTSFPVQRSSINCGTSQYIGINKNAPSARHRRTHLRAAGSDFLECDLHGKHAMSVKGAGVADEVFQGGGLIPAAHLQLIVPPVLPEYQ